MPLDPDALRLAEDLVLSAKRCRFGTLMVEVVTRYAVDVRNGKVMARTVKEILPRVTIEQLREERREEIIS